MAAVRIDGRQVQVEQGTTLLQAAAKLGIPIPTLCSLEGFEPNTSCMICVVEEIATGRLLPSCSAPAEEGTAVLTDSPPVRKARRAALELLLAEHVGDCEAPCTLACPLGIDIAEVLRRLESGAVGDALTVIRRATAFPGLACRLCSAPCESACRRGGYDEAVAIREALYGVGAAPPEEASPKPPPGAGSAGDTVAVIGAGPAGLSAAYHLGLLGHRCRVFESEKRPGGSLRGLGGDDPEARRIADGAVERATSILVELGADIRTSTAISDPRSLRDTMDGHRAVIVTAGRHFQPILEETGIPARGSPGLFAAGSLRTPGCSFVRALAQGKSAAFSADQYLAGKPVGGTPRHFQSRIGRLLEGEISEFLEGSAESPRVLPPADPAAVEASRCLQCDCGAKDSCRLRSCAEAFAARARRFRLGTRRRFERVRQHSRIVYEPGKCIRCGICVAITARENEPLGLAFLKRGYDLQVGTPFAEPLSRALERSAELCVRNCPTGALYFRRRPRKEQ